MGEPESIGIREVRQHASRYVAMAKAGRRVPVTERGTLVACLVPAEEPSSPFERLVAAGRVRQATIRGIADLMPPPPPEPHDRRAGSSNKCDRQDRDMSATCGAHVPVSMITARRARVTGATSTSSSAESPKAARKPKGSATAPSPTAPTPVPAS